MCQLLAEQHTHDPATDTRLAERSRNIDSNRIRALPAPITPEEEQRRFDMLIECEEKPLMVGARWKKTVRDLQRHAIARFK